MDKVSLTSLGEQESSLLRKYTYANLMTQAGNKNCQPLWLFKTFTGATKKTPLTAIELFLAHELSLSLEGQKKLSL